MVADEDDERIQGLRGRADVGRYDGMLFVFDAPDRHGVHDVDGAGAARHRLLRPPTDGVVDRLPDGAVPATSEARCARATEPQGEFRYALETLAGDLPHGARSASGRPDRCHTRPA